MTMLARLLKLVCNGIFLSITKFGVGFEDEFRRACVGHGCLSNGSETK